MQSFLSSQARLYEFGELTRLSYAVTQDRLAEASADAPMLPFNRWLGVSGFDSLSYAFGDVSQLTEGPVCEWIALAEYAERSGKHLAEVELQLEADVLGPTGADPMSGDCLVLWPPKYHLNPASGIPPVGDAIMGWHFNIDAWISDPEEGPECIGDSPEPDLYLRMCQELGAPEEITSKAFQLLNQSLFLSHWSSFEVFVRETVDTLLRWHPRKLATGKNKDRTIRLADLLTSSSDLTEMGPLRDHLIESEIDRRRDAGQSIHGLLNFLRDEFRFARDPYVNGYVLRGEPGETSYRDLVDLKTLRNALMHEGSAPISSNQPPPVIDEETVLRTRTVLRAIAYGVSRQILDDEYQAT